MFASFNVEASGGLAGAVGRILAASADHANDKSSSFFDEWITGLGQC